MPGTVEKKHFHHRHSHGAALVAPVASETGHHNGGIRFAHGLHESVLDSEEKKGDDKQEANRARLPLGNVSGRLAWQLLI